MDRKEQFREFARMILSQDKSISAAEINRRFKQKFGKGLNKQQYLNVVREIKGIEISEKRQKAGILGGRRGIPEIEKTSGHQLRKYHYFVSFKVHDNVEGEEYEDYITVSSNEKLSKKRVKEIAKQILEENNLLYRNERKALISTIKVEYVSIATGKTKILLGDE